MNLPSKIFNVEKQYGNDRLFFGQDPGLLDAINVKYPQIDNLYRRLKANDWDRAEFNYTQDNLDFKTVDKSLYQSMLWTLIFQTSADSVASRSIAPVLQQCITNSELNAAICMLQSQENLHADSYSFAIRNCFDDPQGVIKEAEKLIQSHSRLEVIATVFESARVASFEYALGKRTEEYTYPYIMNMMIALYSLEAIQFISSFAITAAFWEANLFKSVGSMVRLIMRDEQDHAALDRTIIDIELKTPQGKKWLSENKDDIEKIITEVVESEYAWTHFIFDEGRQTPGLNEELVRKYIQFIAQGVFDTVKIKQPYPRVHENPLPYMNRYALLSNNQAAPQEQAERASEYLIGGFTEEDYEMDI